jgi:3',5'-nucleoside bisphosphate phosphatase
MNKIDLHIHSEFSSDGELGVEKIIDLSKAKGVDIIAITDHNSVNGVQHAIEYGNTINVKVIPGIEIDCTYKNINLHVLGYFIDYKRAEFSQLENDIYEKEKKVALAKIIKLRDAINVKVDIEYIFKKANGRIITGEAIAENVLNSAENTMNPLLQPYLSGGKKCDMPYVNFYWDFFSKGKVAYIPIEYISLQEAIALIKLSGGIPVIAHPGNNLKNNPEILDELIQEGIEGIEVLSTYHTVEQAIYYYNKALQYQLLVTCGSDFHGANKPNIDIGEYTMINQNVDVLSEFIKYISNKCTKKRQHSTTL